MEPNWEPWATVSDATFSWPRERFPRVPPVPASSPRTSISAPAGRPARPGGGWSRTQAAGGRHLGAAVAGDELLERVRGGQAQLIPQDLPVTAGLPRGPGGRAPTPGRGGERRCGR